MKCPYCACENPEGAASCVSCLREFGPPSPAPAPPTAGGARCERCGFANPEGATQCGSCLAPLAVPALQEVLAPARRQRAKSRLPWLIAAVVAVAVVFWAKSFLAPQPDRAPMPSPPAEKPAQPAPSQPRERQAAKPEPAKPAPSAARAKAVEEAEDPGAEVRYRVAQDWLKRGEKEKARQALAELVTLYPRSRHRREAQLQLDNLPRAPSPARPAAREESFDAWKARYEAEVAAGRKPPTVTDEELAAMKRGGSRRPTPPASLPPSIAQAARPATAPPGVQLSLLSVLLEADRVVLHLAYQLPASRQHAVYAGARLSFPRWPQTYFAYSAQALATGSGEAQVAVEVPAEVLAAGRPSSVRLMLFESQGPMFFSQDVPYPAPQ